MSDHTEVAFSETESHVLKLKVGRCNAIDFEPNELFEQILADGYDVCRLKVPSEDEMAPLKLDSMGIPYSFSGSIRRYRTPIPEYPIASMRHPSLEFIQYDAEESHDELLKFMLEETWGDYPIGYYRSPLLHNFCPKETEIESVFQFYRKFNNNKNYEQNSIMFMKDKGEFVGFFALNIVGEHLESHIGGIIRKHRRSGYFHDMLHYIRRFCVDNHLGHFVFGARNENAAVQKAFEQEGFNSIGSENVFHLCPLLSVGSTDRTFLGVDSSMFDLNGLQSFMHGTVEGALRDKMILDHRIQKQIFIPIVNLKDGLRGNLILSLDHPIVSEHETMSIAQLRTGDGETIAIQYLQTSRGFG